MRGSRETPRRGRIAIRGQNAGERGTRWDDRPNGIVPGQPRAGQRMHGTRRAAIFNRAHERETVDETQGTQDRDIEGVPLGSRSKARCGSTRWSASDARLPWRPNQEKLGDAPRRGPSMGLKSRWGIRQRIERRVGCLRRRNNVEKGLGCEGHVMGRLKQDLAKATRVGRLLVCSLVAIAGGRRSARC